MLKVVKASQMGHFVMFLFGVHPYQPTLDFAFFILEWTIVNMVKRIWCYVKKKELPNDSGRPLSYSDFADKKQNGWY